MGGDLGRRVKASDSEPQGEASSKPRLRGAPRLLAPAPSARLTLMARQSSSSSADSQEKGLPKDPRATACIAPQKSSADQCHPSSLLLLGPVQTSPSSPCLLTWNSCSVEQRLVAQEPWMLMVPVPRALHTSQRWDRALHLDMEHVRVMPSSQLGWAGC